MKNAKLMILSSVIVMISLWGCKTAPTTEEARNVLNAEVTEAISVFKARDPSIQNFFDTSYGYAVFPKVYKGGFWVGGAYGKGQVYQQKDLIGYSSLTQATVGFTFGGEYFREIVFFNTKPDFDNFITGQYAFSAQATGVALTEGAAAKANYENGVLVFIIAQKGLMLDVSLGGQKFEYTPVSVANQEK